jgi:hypothetical protein
MPIDQFVNSKILLALVSGWAAGQANAIARDQARIQNRSSALPSWNWLARPLSISWTLPHQKLAPLPSSSHMRSTNSA